MSPGIDEKTLDGTFLPMIQDIIHQMRTNESFQFQRSRKITIPQPNGATRSLSIVSPRDKIVQEAIRIILESIYDSPHGRSLSPVSLGVPKSMSTHNARQYIKQNWTGST
jgi:retron-type reverse transcriptase